MLVRPDGVVPKERYTSRAFVDLEMERLWSRVWQVACREEEIAEVGDFVEYAIGDQSILEGADGTRTLKFFHTRQSKFTKHTNSYNLNSKHVITIQVLTFKF
jgi:phenylpropionate dioxygenase-like ring-hydroxylating dioxygenase large terminal subunit